MDENKSIKLKEINYKIHECCGTCKFAMFGFSDWGKCALHEYKHKKHSGGDKSSLRDLSIHKFGSCSSYSPADDYINEVFGHFKF